MEMDAMYEQLGIERKVLEFGKEIEGLLSERFAAVSYGFPTGERSSSPGRRLPDSAT